MALLTRRIIVHSNVNSLSKPIICSIQVAEKIDPSLITSQYQMDFSYKVDDHQNPSTLFDGNLPDYAALYGILNYLYGIGLRLISVKVSLANPE